MPPRAVRSRRARAAFLAFFVLFAAGCAEAPREAPPPAHAPETVPDSAVTAEPAAAPGPVAPASKTPDGTEAAAPAPEEAAAGELARALERVAALEEDARFSEALQLCRELRAKFASHPRAREIDEAAFRLKESRRAALDLPFAVASLGSDRPEAVMAAKDALLGAGEVGAIFLRKAVRAEADAVAAGAAEILAEGLDPRAARVILERLGRAGAGPARDSLLRALVALVSEGRGLDVLPDAYALVREDDRYAAREYADVLVVAFARACAGDGARFGELAGDPGAHATLKRYVDGAMASGDAALAAWAARCAGALGLSRQGLRGSYYEGTEFERLVAERLDPKIEFPTLEGFPYPDGRREQVSVRWTGSVRVAAAGTYTFYSASDDGQRLWVKGRLLVDDWHMHGVEERSGEIELAPGLHDFKVEFMQGGGGAAITVSWEGPGIAKQVIPAECLFTLPWQGME